MARTVTKLHTPLQTWSKAGEDTSKHCWGLIPDANTQGYVVSRIYKIK